MNRIGTLLLSIIMAVGGLGLSAARADVVATIWTNSASFGAPVLQEFDLDGNLLKSITAPNGINGRGVVQVGDVLYYTSADTNGVYAYNFVTDTDLGTVFSVSGASGLATMAFDGTNFYIGDYSGTNNVYKYAPDGTLLDTIALSQCSGFCDGLEFANNTLISNEFDGCCGVTPVLYDVYDLNGNLITPGFLSNDLPSTGIAFDGTNYYLSNVFNGSISVYDSSGAFVRTFTLNGGFGDVEDISVNYAIVLGTVPEPATWSLMLAAFGALGLMVRRRKFASA
jgi:hypothetical protein